MQKNQRLIPQVTSESNPDQNAPTIGGFLQNLHVVVEGEAAVVLA